MMTKLLDQIIRDGELPDWLTDLSANEWDRLPFALRGKAYRILSIGSTNRRTNGHHFEPHVLAEPLFAADRWAFPSLPASKIDIAVVMKDLFAMPAFYPEDMAQAMRLAR